MLTVLGMVQKPTSPSSQTPKVFAHGHLMPLLFSIPDVHLLHLYPYIVP